MILRTLSENSEMLLRLEVLVFHSGHCAAKTFYVEEDWKSSCTLDTPARDRLKEGPFAIYYYVLRNMDAHTHPPRGRMRGWTHN